MKVTKRNGESEELQFDKVLQRLRNLVNHKSLGTLKNIDPDVISQQVIKNIYDGVKTTELDEVAARITIGLSTEHPEYSELASRIIISNMHKNTSEDFNKAMEILFHNKTEDGIEVPLVSENLIKIANENKEKLNSVLDYSRDYLFDYFGFKTLERSYLLKIYSKEDKEYKIIERPQHMWLRVSLGIHGEDIEKAIETYNLMSTLHFTHASPTLFNSGTPRPQLSSCFHEDTIVTTVNKGPLKIKNVQKGDEVITHLGNVKKVVQIHKNELNGRKFYDLNISKTAPIKVTDNHKLWVLSKQNTTPGWKSVEDLTDGDFVSIPNKKEKATYTENLDISSLKNIFKEDEKYDFQVDETSITMISKWKHNNLNNNQTIKCSRKHSQINRYWKVEDTFAKFLGVFYGDGHIMTKDKIPSGVGITIHDKNTELIKFCEETGYKIFGIKPCVHKMKNQNVVQVLYNSKYIGHVFTELFGKGFNGKKLWMEMYAWGRNLVLSFLEGLITTDGCVSKDDIVSVQMSNVDFMRGLYYLLRNNNIDTSYGNVKTPKNSTKDCVQINIPRDEINKDNITKFYNDDRMTHSDVKKSRNQYSHIEVNGFKFLKYISKTQIQENLPKYVYTLGIEDDHSYNVEGIIAENCFLLGIDDSMQGIYKCLSDCAINSKHAGGIGLHVSNIRSKGSYIKGTNGRCDGIVKMLKVFNETARFANQGSKRNGSFAIYLEPWHEDIYEFLELRKNSGDEALRARDLFYAMWICDAFMVAVKKDDWWYLMSEDTNKGLTDAYGEEFTKLYYGYVEAGNYRKKIKARDLWQKILVSQIETGMPYMSYKDSVNMKCNQKNIGTVKSSNLCVAGDTNILTSEGVFKIKDLEGKQVKIWNSKMFSQVTPTKTGENQKLINVRFNNGSELKCTPYHKFYIQNVEEKNTDVVEAKDLKPGMKLIDCKFPVIKEGKDDFKAPYEHGLFSADQKYFPEYFKHFKDDNVEEFKFLSFPPINCNLQTKLKWLAGFFDGSDVRMGSDVIYIENYIVPSKFLTLVKYLLQTLGVNPVVNRNILILYCSDVQGVVDLGFSSKKLNIQRISSLNFKTKLTVSVEDISEVSGTHDTYCFNEPLEHKGIFNGVVTGNCNEITLVSSPEETAVCNICTFSLPKYVEKNSKGKFVYDHKKLYDVVKIATRNMNNIIGLNFYPTPETKRSNLRHRPIAMGIQGLANVFFKMKIPFESEEARVLNKDIMETIQYAGWTASMELAREKGMTYETYEGSPISKGIFQHNMWGVDDSELDGRWNWDKLRRDIKEHGVLNSMITALPPTASTSQILGNYESFEPQNSNMFMRSTMSGDFPIINKYLINDLIDLGIWDNDMKAEIINDNGSVQHIQKIPDHIKKIYKTIWEIPQKHLIDFSADRALFVDQTQSLNCFVQKPNIGNLTSMHFYAWEKGLKTGMYYLRSKAANQAEKFTVSQSIQQSKKKNNALLACSIDNREECVSCSG